MFEIPACRSTQGRPFTSTTNMSRQVFLSPFRKTSLPVLITLFSLIQEYPSADRHAAHQCFSLSLAAAEYTVINGVSREATLGVFRSIPGHPARQQTDLPSLAPPRLFARFSPDNSQEALCGILSESVRMGRILTLWASGEPSPQQPNGKDFHRYSITDEPRSSAGLVMAPHGWTSNPTLGHASVARPGWSPLQRIRRPSHSLNPGTDSRRGLALHSSGRPTCRPY